MTDPISAEGFLPLHPLEFRVLMVLTKGASFGSEIVRRIENAEGGRAELYPANLFRRVRTLLSRDLLEECEAPQGADPRRNYVRLTGLGRAVARAEALRLSALVSDARAFELLGADG